MIDIDHIHIFTSKYNNEKFNKRLISFKNKKRL